MMASHPLVLNVKRWSTFYTIIYILIIVRHIRDTTAFFPSNQFSATCSHLSTPSPRVIFCNKLLLKPSSSHRYIIYPQPRRRIHNFLYYQSTTRHMAKSTYLNSHDSNQSLPPINDSSNNVCIRILCLHGKGGNGHQFINSSLLPLRSLIEKRLSSLNNNEEEGIDSSSISFQWESLTAPYEISPPSEEEKDDGGYSWWTMPPGVRSYTANEVRRYCRAYTTLIHSYISLQYAQEVDMY